MNFQDTIDTLRQRLHADSPVAQARARLASPRAALVADLKVFKKRKPTPAHLLGEARAKQQQAASVGVRHATLDHILKEAYGGEAGPGLLDSIELLYQAGIDKIDSLTEMDLNYQGYEAHLMDQPRLLRANPSSLEALAKEAQRLTKDGGELDQMVKQAAGQPPATMTTGTPPGQSSKTGLRVESDFQV